ncbi:restin homolog isoform X2 [Tribolium castaneum]
MEQDMFAMQFNENSEPPDPRIFENSNQMLSPENQVVEQETEQVEREHITQQVEEEHVTEQVEETRQPLYKLQNFDTEASIKNEIKQLILTNAAEEISAKALEDKRFEVEREITNLRNKTHQLVNKTEDLRKEVETDHERIVRSEEILLKTTQLIDLLKENVEKLQVRLRQSQMGILLNNSVKQYANLETLRKLYEPEIKKKKESIEALKATSNERILNLKEELRQEQAALEDLKRKYEEIKKHTSNYDEEIEKSLNNMKILEQKLAEVEIKKKAVESDFSSEAEKYESLRTKEEDQIAKLTKLNKKRIQLEQHLEEMVGEVDQIKNNITEVECTVSKRELELKELEEKLGAEKMNFQEISDELQKKFDDMSSRLSEIASAVTFSLENNNGLLNTINALKSKYSQMCEEKLALTNKILKQQEEIHSANIGKMKKQMETEHARVKFEELQRQYDTSVAMLQSLKNQITKEKQQVNDQLLEAKAKLETAQAEHENRLSEMRKKLEYQFASSNYWTEKSEDLQREANEAEKALQNLEEENNSLQELTAKKLARLNELKNNLENLKNVTAEVPLKSLFKSPNAQNVPKKVKFNEQLSFKSATSSENSSLPVEKTTARPGQLDNSFETWLKNFQADSDESSDKEY